MPEHLLQSQPIQSLNIKHLLQGIGALITAPASDLISLPHAAKRRGVSHFCLYQMVIRGSIQAIRMTDNRLYIKLSDLDALPPPNKRARKWRQVVDNKEVPPSESDLP